MEVFTDLGDEEVRGYEGVFKIDKEYFSLSHQHFNSCNRNRWWLDLEEGIGKGTHVNIENTLLSLIKFFDEEIEGECRHLVVENSIKVFWSRKQG